MCGIAGFFSASYQDNNIILSLTNTLKHRGPDDEGYLAVDTENLKVFELIGDDSVINGEHIKNFKDNANLFLGHRRLSIIDPTPAGHQPMANDDKTIWIVFNGEIYNYLEIRDELKSKGYIFKTASDTEVIIKAYEEWGFDCLHKFNGMWAFVILDLRKKFLFGARDRFGVKPLYYYWDNQNFAFASEIKALLKLPFYKKEINDRAVFDYLVFAWSEKEEETFFKGIYELMPSNYFILNLKSNHLLKEQYYQLKYNDKSEVFDESKAKEYIDKTRFYIEKAVRLRLRSDVPIGSCLSGGVDSSSIVCIINNFLKNEKIENIGDRQKVFTAVYENESIDESKWANIVVKKTNSDWKKIYPKYETLINELEDLIYFQDIPFASTSIYAQYKVMEEVKKNNVKVLLDGQGADELFTGYTSYYLAFYKELISTLSFSHLFSEIKYNENAPWGYLGIFKELLKNELIIRLPENIFCKLFIKNRGELKLLPEDFILTNKDQIVFFRDIHYKNLNQMLFKFMTLDNLKQLLRYEDRNSMRFSIEARAPFSDDINLIEYVFNVAGVYKIHNGWSKYLLRQSMKGVVPDEILFRRDKIGFATPCDKWNEYILRDMCDIVNNLLRDYFGQNKLDSPIGFLKGKSFSWRFVNFALWYKIFFKNNSLNKI